MCLALVRLFAKRGPTRASKKGGGLSDAYLSYCRDIDVSPNDLLRKAFAYRGFSRNEISSTALKAEVDLKAKGFSQVRKRNGIVFSHFILTRNLEGNRLRETNLNFEFSANNSRMREIEFVAVFSFFQTYTSDHSGRG